MTNTRFRIRLIIEESGVILSLLIALFGLCLFFSITSPYFLTIKNILNFLSATAILGIMAAGLFVTMLMGQIDISQYAVLAFSTGVLAIVVRSGVAVSLSIIIALSIVLACGAVNGFSVAFLKINPIITTLGTMLIFRGLAYMITETKVLGVSGHFFSVIGSGRLLGIPISIYIMVFVFALVYVILKFTVYGKRIYAVGGNAEASYISGINVKMVRFWGMIVSAAAAGVAAITYVSQVGVAVPSAGTSALMNVITAVVLGGISLAGGKGSILGTLLGVLILAVLNNGMVLLSVQTFYQMMVRGAVLMLAVYVDTLQGGGFKIKG